MPHSDFDGKEQILETPAKGPSEEWVEIGNLDAARQIESKEGALVGGNKCPQSEAAMNTNVKFSGFLCDLQQTIPTENTEDNEENVQVMELDHNPLINTINSLDTKGDKNNLCAMQLQQSRKGREDDDDGMKNNLDKKRSCEDVYERYERKKGRKWKRCGVMKRVMWWK